MGLPNPEETRSKHKIHNRAKFMLRDKLRLRPDCQCLDFALHDDIQNLHEQIEKNESSYSYLGIIILETP